MVEVICLEKKVTQEFWDHLVDSLTFTEGNIISLYVGCRIIGSLTISEKRGIVSIVEQFRRKCTSKNILNKCQMLQER